MADIIWIVSIEKKIKKEKKMNETHPLKFNKNKTTKQIYNERRLLLHFDDKAQYKITIEMIYDKLDKLQYEKCVI